MKAKKTYFISMGEYSGDLLAAELVVALREVFPGLSPFGVVGEATRASEVEEVASLDDFSVMGVVEVGRKLADFCMLERRLLDAVEARKPEFAILVDFPGFHLRLAEQLKLRGVKVIQYIAPKLWAHGSGRAGRLRRDFDLVLGVFPFEEKYFKDLGVNFRYVGSPHRDRAARIIVDRDVLGIPRALPVIACLPGSRPSELRRILPMFMDVRREVLARLPDALFLVPIAPSLRLEEIARDFPEFGRARFERHSIGAARLGVESFAFSGFHFVRGMSLEAMAIADAALVASGTATLECALLGTPMTVLYRLNPLTYWLAKRLLTVKWVSLPNILAGEEVVKEFIQVYSPADVAAEVVQLVGDTERRRAVCAKYDELRRGLKGGASRGAAAAISQLMNPS